MIKILKVIFAEELQPHRNQAIERALLDSCGEGEMILYLWRNEKTVFLGKNQNAYTECRISRLKSDGGFLARRFTGGGAVYHDSGNLNFTLLARRADYDIQNQFAIMMGAMRHLGLNAELNGRNDVLIDGKKISGNAFYKSEGACLHHGTILIRSDREAIERYLTVSNAKLLAKGVKSVKSRVGNLTDFCADLTPEIVARAMIESLFRRYPDAERVTLSERDLPGDVIEKYRAYFSEESYLLGDNVTYSTQLERRFSWGLADVRLEMEGDLIKRARIYSDALDFRAVEEKEKLLTGMRLDGEPDSRVKDIIEALGEREHEI